VRDDLMRRGATLSQATMELVRRFGVKSHVLPMTDNPVRTRFTTDQGELSFQEYFVKERLRPKLRAVSFAGVQTATPTSQVVAALAEADVVVIGPSNPLISVAPILRLVGARLMRARTVAVTPIVAGSSLKGPTVEMMKALGLEPSPVEVARMYRDLAGTYVLDERDAMLAVRIEELGYRVVVCDTVMRDGGGALAEVVLSSV
jgi:LPPG:FO 2-phospho-L-lactate transferase